MFSIVGIAGADVSSMVTIKAIVWGLAGGAVITVFILSFIAFLVYMDMMSKQTLYVGDLSRVRRSPMNISSLVIVGAYIFGLFLGNLLLFFLIATLLGFTSYQGIIFVMVDIVLIVYLTRFLLNRAVSLYDSISIIR
ncbi:MAG: hypothetical protein KAU14_07075 [Thermoplasmata archaeon]|nr:hypothetical protein [Thermoplasmata archaeon]